MREAVVLFSGGVDSTYVAARSAPAWDRLLLLTYRVPGMVGVERSRRSAAQLQRLFGARVEHRVVDLRGWIGRLRGGVTRCVAANARHGFAYAWCLGCKTGMQLATMAFCEARGIGTVLDGSNAFDAHALEQSAPVHARFQAAYRARGLTLQSPEYDDPGVAVRPGLRARVLRRLTLLKDSTEARVRWCRSQGLDPGPGLGSQYRTTQPSCVTSVAFNAARLAVVRLERPDGALRYVEELLARAALLPPPAEVGPGAGERAR